MHTSSCEVCENPIPVSRANRHSTTCCEQCARERVRRRYRSVGIPAGKAAAASAARSLVIAKLLREGHAVYQNVADGQPGIKVDGRLIRVEVHVGYRRTSGTIQWPKPREWARDCRYFVVIGDEIVEMSE